MTVTDGDTFRVGDEPATEPATGQSAAGGEPQLARARDGHDTPADDTLPDTDSDMSRFGDEFHEWWGNVQDVGAEIWSGRIWDEQPPSPRELVERCLDSPWMTGDKAWLALMRRVGCALSLLWTVPLYLLAICGQRHGRVLTALLFAVAMWRLG